ncbi:uncharacterized protein LOC143539355 [Bidens hawaiensis]|uniref:uncharacterized protein LOC143539355 n=1 Tax=Bidens hawaiensis TaxID=980011 RepID=UPI004049CEFE
MDNGDDWLAHDKLQHFVLCFFITIIISFIASHTKHSLLRRHSISIGCILSLTAGAAKEIADELGFFNSAGASVKDAVADVTGALFAVVVISVWNKFCVRDRSKQLEQNRVYEMV